MARGSASDKAGSRISFLARAIGVFALLVSFPAWPKEPADDDYDTKQGADDGFWGAIHRPLRQRYLELVEAGRLFLEGRRFGDAVRALSEAVHLEPERAEGHFFLGMAHRGEGRHGACADALTLAAKLDPSFVPPDGQAGTRLSLDFHLAFCLAIAGRVEESIPHYQRVLAEAPQGGPGDAWLVRWNLGDSFQALGRLSEAIEAYRRGAEQVPGGEAMLYFALGVAYDRDGQTALARDAVLLGLALDPLAHRPSSPDVLFVPAEDKDYYLGFAHEIAGRRAGALVYFRRYVALAAQGLWMARAKEHLAALGELANLDLDLRVEDRAFRQTLRRVVLRAAPALERCLANEPYAWVQVTLTGKSPRSVPVTQRGPAKTGMVLATQPGPLGPEVVSLGPISASSEAMACVSTHLAPLSQLMEGKKGAVTFAVIAPR